jgi:hypothetical protein
MIVDERDSRLQGGHACVQGLETWQRLRFKEGITGRRISCMAYQGVRMGNKDYDVS